MPLAGNEYVLHSKRKTLNFSYFLWRRYWLNKRYAIAKTQQKSRAIFQNFSPGKRTFGSSVQTASPKLLEWRFLDS